MMFAAVFAIERQRGVERRFKVAAHAVQLLGLAGPAHFVGDQVHLPAAHPGGTVGALQEVLAAFQLTMQRLGLAHLRHQRAALLQHLGGDPGKVHHQLALGRRQHAGHRIEQAQRADTCPVRRAQRDASVVPDARPTRHQWIGGKTRVLARIGYLEQLVLAYGMGAEGNFAGRFADAFKADVGLEPLAVFGHHADQAHGHAGCGAGGGDDGIEHRLRGRIQQVQSFDFEQSFGFVHGAFQGWVARAVAAAV